MLGHVLFDVLKSKRSDKFEVIGVNRSGRTHERNVFNLDVLDFDNLEQSINKIRPSFIVNCVGTLVESSNRNPLLAIRTNAMLPWVLDELSQKYHFKLIHISTDCVFDGKTGKHKEMDKKTESNFYGLSKSLGEVINSRALTIRTSIIGPELKDNPTGLFEWVLSQRGKTISGYQRAIWSGLTTLELSNFIIWCMDQDISGIVHATNNTVISKFNLIELINDKLKLNINVVPNLDFISDKTLVNSRINNYVFPSYEKMIDDMNNWNLEF